MLNPTNDKTRELHRMKSIATLLLVTAFILFIVTSLFQKQYPWLGFPRAMFEAAMVGAIADWFAVTALFRHPLGLKIPHTAIIPERKQVIGQRLGQFVRVKFLSEEIISEKLHAMQVTRQVAEWLSQPANSERVAQQASIGLAALTQVINDEEIQALIERKLGQQIRATHFAPILGQLLALVLAGERQRQLLFWTVELGAKFLQDNKTLILQLIQEQLPTMANLFKLDYKIYEKLVEAVDLTLQEASTDPKHPLHASFGKALSKLLVDLQTSPEFSHQEEVLKEDLLAQHSVMHQFSASIWLDMKDTLVARSQTSEQGIHQPIQQMLIRLGETLQNDPILFDKVDHWLNEITLYLIRTYGHEVENLISQTIDRWDTAKITAEMEQEVGSDLQFIRINGTIIGGLAGLVIYTVSSLIQWLS